MHKINYLGFGNSFESVCCNGQPLLERGQYSSRTFLLVSGACLGRWRFLLQLLLPLKQSLCVCMVRPSLARGLCFGRRKWSFNAIQGSVLPVSVLDPFGIEDFEAVAPVPGGMEGQMFTSGSQAVAALWHLWGQWSITRCAEQGRVVVLEEVALSAQHPLPASPSLLCWGGLRHSPVPLQLLQPLLDAGVKATPPPEPASISQVLINISPAVITGVWGWPPLSLEGKLVLGWAKQDFAWSMMPVKCWVKSAQPLLGESKASTDWALLSKYLPCPSGKPLQRDRDHGTLALGSKRIQTSSPYHTELELMN